jgi:outer membrane lipoprotein
MSDRQVLHLSLCAFVVMAAGCASQVPRELRSDAPETLAPRAVQADPVRHLGREVLWGGEILAVRNASSFTDIELYARPLARDAEPRVSGGDGVRFIARVHSFLDPAEYQAGKRLSVRGHLAPPETRPIGEFPYRYPLVDVAVFHLWPKFQPLEPWRYYDPFYDPWWPGWGRWRPYPSWPWGW